MSKSGRKYTTALSVQGGGALVAFAIGSYAVAHERGHEPDICAGISFGGIVNAIIAGNAPEERLPMLKSFMRKISWPSFQLQLPTELNYAWQHWIGWTQAVMLGQPNFFRQRPLLPWFAMPGTAEATSFYDTSPLRKTLLEHVDFDRINAKSTSTRLMLGAVKVRSGEMVFFDNEHEKITVDHVMATGALPVGFPGIRIGDELYWDGGIHSNTTIDVILERTRGRDLHILAPVMFCPKGSEPRTLPEVERRMMEIRYGSHSHHRIADIKRAHDIRLAIDQVLKHADPQLQQKFAALWTEGRSHDVEISEVEYHAPDYETAHNDADFSDASIQRRFEAGYNAMSDRLDQFEQCHEEHIVL